MKEPTDSCGRCADGWVCETYPDAPVGHEVCGGAGIPCENPECRHSIRRAGLVCPSCRRAIGTIETQTARVIAFN